MAELAERVLESLFGLSDTAVYLLVALLCWAEAAFFLGFVTPGELAVAAGGILASRGQATYTILVAVVVVATIAGNATGFALGKRWGTGVLEWKPLRTVFGGGLARAQAFMLRRGEWAIVLGRLATPTRIVVPFLAGSSGMAYRRYVVFDIPATVAWAVVWTGIGYVLGESWDLVREVAGTAAILVLILFVLALVIRWVTALVARNRRRVQAMWRFALRVTGTRGVARALSPAFFWMGRRLDPRLAKGLSLTVAFLVLVGAAGAAGIVLNQTRAVRGLALLDFPVLDWMVATRTDEAVALARGVLRFFRWPGVLVLALPLAGVTYALRGLLPALRVGVGIAGAGGGAYFLDRFVIEGLVPRAEFPSVTMAVAAALLVHATAVAARRFGWTPAVATAGVSTFLLCVVGLGTVVAGWAAPSGIALGTAMGLGWAALLELPSALLAPARQAPAPPVVLPGEGLPADDPPAPPDPSAPPTASSPP
jgi:membrane protein DedA with SNARE-associated domain